MKKFFSSLFSSEGEVSSKRFIGILSALVMFFIAIVDLFTNQTVAEYIFDSLMWLTISGLGFIASEKLEIFKRK